MGHIRRGRFVGLSVVGLALAGVAGVATAQNGIDFAAGSSVADATVRGLYADGAEILPAHGPFGSSDDPTMMIRLSDVRVDSVCIRFRSLHVPVLGEVSLVGTLDENDEFGARGLVVDANEVEGELVLDGARIGAGIGSPSDRADASGIAVAGQALDAPNLEVSAAGITADQVTLKGLRLQAQRGPGTC